MTFKFPTSGTTLSVPPIGTTFGVGTKVWSWDGSVFFRSDLGQRGATGSTGTGITNVKIGNDGKLSFNFDDKEGITVDLGDVIKPAGFKYSINVNPGSTGIALIGTQGATSNFLTFNNFDLDGNDTTKFFNTIVENPKNTTLTIRSLVGATQVSLGIDNSSITTGSFRVFQGISGSGFTSPFEIGDTVFLFKEVSGKTGSGITNPELTSDGKLTFDIIDSEGITTSKIDVGVVRGATGSGKINTDPLTDPANELTGNTSDFDPLAFIKNTISFGDLSVADKAATDTNKTIFAVRDFPDTSGFGGGGISGEDVLIQSKRGLKLARVDLNSGLSPTPAYADFAIRLMGSDTQGGVTIPAGTDILLKGTGFDFSAGGSSGVFTIDQRQAFGVKVNNVPFTATNLIAGEDGISLGAGISFPDGTHQTSAHAPHEFVASFNGATGAVEGVNSFNGLTGAVSTTDLTLQVAGISVGASGITNNGAFHNVVKTSAGISMNTAGLTFPDGTHLTSEGQIAFKNEANNFTQNNKFTSGKGLGSNGDSQPSLIFNDNFVTTIGDFEAEANNYHLKVDDQNETVQVIGGGGVEYDFGVLTLDAKGNLIKTTSKVQSSGISLDSNGITFPDSTHQKGAAKDVATFTIKSSSAFSLGQKIEAMYRMPYDAKLLELEGKLSSAGNVRGHIEIAGPDFGDPTTSRQQAIDFTHNAGGISFDNGSLGTFNLSIPSVTAGNFLYVNMTSNSAGATGMQLFLTYETR